VATAGQPDAGLLTGCGMSSIRFLGRGMMWATCGLMILSDAQASARVIHIPEICIRVTVPNGRPVCPDLSLTFHYVHGLYFDKNGDCKADNPKINRIGIWQEANTGDESLKDYVKTACHNRRATPVRRDLRLSGMRSFLCIYPEDHHDLRVNLMGYAGVWDKKPSQPAIFYRAWMVTPRGRLRRDMSAFETFVRSAKIEDGRCLAYLSS
jgi:hypothetical protein